MENNCLYAYDHNLADIRYDFKKHRAVFCIKDKTNKIVDAAGRSLLSNVKPKWYRYGRSRQPFICGDNKVAVVVEDCASAASICSFATGVIAPVLPTEVKISFIIVVTCCALNLPAMAQRGLLLLTPSLFRIDNELTLITDPSISYGNS